MKASWRALDLLRAYCTSSKAAGPPKACDEKP